MLKGYIEGNAKEGQCVGARDEPAGDELEYCGPCARITFDETWLHIITDDYEGHAMLNIEALPKLRQALSRIAHEIDKRALAEKTA